MDKKYFEEYFVLERNHWWFKVRIKILQTHIRFLVKKHQLKDPKILNVGAGTGFTSQILMDFGDTTSVEYDEDCCKMVKEKTGMVFENASITELPYPDNSFDIVTAFDVVEHIEDDQKAVEELQRVTKKGGIIITTVPAYNFLWSQHDVINHHHRRYTRKTYLKLWHPERGKLKKEYNTYFNFILFVPVAAFRLLSNLFSRKTKRIDAGSDFSVNKSGIIDSVLYYLMSMEIPMIKARFVLPFGISYLVSFKKL